MTSNCSKCDCSKRERVLTPCLYCPALNPNLLPDHLPEVCDGGGEWGLGDDVRGVARVAVRHGRRVDVVGTRGVHQRVEDAGKVKRIHVRGVMNPDPKSGA